MTRAEIKAKARQSLKGNWGSAILIMVVLSVVTSLLSATGIGFLLVGPLTIGLAIVFIGGSRKGKFELTNLFSGFKDALGERVLLGFLKNLFIGLWGLLFVIPGIIKTYAYAASEVISAEHPEYTWKQCIDESMRVMQGHKMDLFIQQLSFLGWAILCGFTFGIGFLWLAPYMQASHTEFMLDLLSHDSKLGGAIEANVVR